LNKLSLYPDGDFSISDHSKFREPVWILEKEHIGGTIKINFYEGNDQLSFLKKCIIYHYIPSFHPFGRIKSFQTTNGYGINFSLLDAFLFDVQKLRTFPSNIKLITPRMLNEALDLARVSEFSNHYRSLYSIIVFWAFLSDNKLIPMECRLDIDTSLVDTKDRQKDVSLETMRRNNSYEPFTRKELSILLEYALFWTESALEHIVETRDYSIEFGINKYQKYKVSKRKQLKRLEQLYTYKIDGQVIIGLNHSTKFDKRDNGAITHSYTTKSYFATATDNVRNGVFILVALITGLRRQELVQLKFSDFYQDENGDCFVDISRFKTSNDPNYNGEEDVLPIPDFIYESIQKLLSLREYLNNVRTGYIFQSSKSHKHVKKVTSAIIKIIVREISNECKVDRIHAHRFRKTIAEVLIGQDETNIDVIRELFGHKSYAMTLRYISRNPYFVRAIAEIIGKHYTKEFENILIEVTSGSYSGHAGERIAKQIQKRPNLFKGSALKLTVFNYVSALLSAGEPFFLHRTPMDSYCLSIPIVGGTEATPCVKKMKNNAARVSPDPSNCQYEECTKALITNAAKPAIEDNIIFYTRLLDSKEPPLSAVNHKNIKRKLRVNQVHLDNLNKDISNDLFANNDASQVGK
jgi:integrase